MTTKERLISFLAYIGISQGGFEKKVGLSTGFVNNIEIVSEEHHWIKYLLFILI